jgi:hypothetical protein
MNSYLYHYIMRNSFISFIVLAMSLLSLPVFSQTDSKTEKDTTLLGLPGDNLDLYAVLDLFQKSKTIEDFEKSLNLEKTGINNLDLNLDGKVDFIKVVTKKDGDNFTFILQVAVTEKETQDVAVILVSKDKDKKVTMQVVGDKDLYGKDYVVEPKATPTPAATPNPGYTGSDPLKAPVPASTTTVIIEQTPIVQYVYSPVYVPYIPPYHYGYYPPYFAAFTVMAVGIYRHNNYYCHGAYHGGAYGAHGNTVVVHNTNNYNNYNNSRNSSNTVNHNNANGNYNRNNASTRPSGGAGASTQPANRQSGGAGASTQPANRQSGGAGVSTQPSNRQSAGASASTRPSSSSSMGSSRSSSGGGGSYSGGGGSRGSGGYSGGGGSRGGGGGSRGGGGRR